ncbi:MAG TPA: ribosome small subunit-dependent GTPase A, partial [Candidatus Saccharimonadales bacterium]|nr:ribosome small subunit-dependent GTPase A [Candidatus Saccharimonadales bacterium]
MNPLSAYGWTKELDDLLARHTILGTQPARVVADFGTSLKVALPKIVTAELSGALAHHTHREQVPKVGDWVLVRLTDNSPPVIEALLPRQSEIARKVAGSKTLKQVIAANVDVAFVLLALDNDFSIDRLRRFLYQLSINAIKPVIVLNKADKVENAEEYISQLSSLELPVIAMVATKGTGMAELLNFIAPGKTAVLLGSSGVGKSTLTNRLLERDVQKTHAVRQSDDTGMHTTVHRELFMLPGGGLLIDMPGIRELQLWGTEEALDENFDDIAALFRQCKYASCQHKDDDGCAVQRALKDGTLDPLHYAAYQKMKNELSTLKQR